MGISKLMEDRQERSTRDRLSFPNSAVDTLPEYGYSLLDRPPEFVNSGPLDTTVDGNAGDAAGWKREEETGIGRSSGAPTDSNSCMVSAGYLSSDVGNAL